MGVNVIGAAWMQTQSITSFQWPKVAQMWMTTLWQLVANAILASVINCRMSSSWRK
jgi:hypothetical protein